ncbi:hypothetical protein TNCV_2297871 [Trichonephila clavipes]|nr:hypothetical protein TNCV_2297871 [Trichonephila clavipes]
MPARHGLADMFENNGCFTDRSNSDGYSCHQVHFRIDGRVVNPGSDVPPSSDVPELTFENSVAASLGIFPRTTEQQHIQFR